MTKYSAVIRTMLYMNNNLFIDIFSKICPDYCAYKSPVFWANVLYRSLVLILSPGILFLLCFCGLSVMPLAAFPGYSSCCAPLYAFLSLSDSQEEFLTLLILLKSVLQRSELESVSLHCPSQSGANIH